MMSLGELLKRQDTYRRDDGNEGFRVRLSHLHRLERAIRREEKALLGALREDTGKSEMEGLISELAIVYEEFRYFKRNLPRLLLERRVLPCRFTFPSHGRILTRPYGRVLIISPWNYPIQLMMVPVIGALASGNTVVLKSSRKTPEVNRVMKRIFTKALNEELLYFADEETHDEILKEHFDLYFFTGSERVGRKIAAVAAREMSPCILELGGKSPCLVDETADLESAAKKIIWGKALNAGQTCIAPDYVLVQEKVKKPLIEELKKAIIDREKTGEALPRIITTEKLEQLVSWKNMDKEAIGGEVYPKAGRMELCLLPSAKPTDPCMQEEIFGPILPILSYRRLRDAVQVIAGRPTPLAFYYFTRSRKRSNRLLHQLEFGNAAINDCVLQIAHDHLPFGGKGASGIGSYHGKYSYRIFQRRVGVLVSHAGIRNPLRFPPFTKWKKMLIRLFM